MPCTKSFVQFSSKSTKAGIFWHNVFGNKGKSLPPGDICAPTFSAGILVGARGNLADATADLFLV